MDAQQDDDDSLQFDFKHVSDAMDPIMASFTTGATGLIDKADEAVKSYFATRFPTKIMSVCMIIFYTIALLFGRDVKRIFGALFLVCTLLWFILLLAGANNPEIDVVYVIYAFFTASIVATGTKDIASTFFNIAVSLARLPVTLVICIKRELIIMLVAAFSGLCVARNWTWYYFLQLVFILWHYVKRFFVGIRYSVTKICQGIWFATRSLFTLFLCILTSPFTFIRALSGRNQPKEVSNEQLNKHTATAAYTSSAGNGWAATEYKLHPQKAISTMSAASRPLPQTFRDGSNNGNVPAEFKDIMPPQFWRPPVKKAAAATRSTRPQRATTAEIILDPAPPPRAHKTATRKADGHTSSKKATSSKATTSRSEPSDEAPPKKAPARRGRPRKVT